MVENIDFEAVLKGAYFVTTHCVPWLPNKKGGVYLAKIDRWDEELNCWIVKYAACMERNDSAYLERGEWCYFLDSFLKCRMATQKEIEKFTKPNTEVKQQHNDIGEF